MASLSQFTQESEAKIAWNSRGPRRPAGSCWARLSESLAVCKRTGISAEGNTDYGTASMALVKDPSIVALPTRTDKLTAPFRSPVPTRSLNFVLLASHVAHRLAKVWQSVVSGQLTIGLTSKAMGGLQTSTLLLSFFSRDVPPALKCADYCKPRHPFPVSPPYH